MTAFNIFLVLISGMGVLHGLFLALFLNIESKYNTTSNKFLSLLLIIFSFRVGKSVILEFTEDLEVRIIFIGLATLMAIGPLFYFYITSLENPKFKFKSIHLTHFILSFLGILFGLWINEDVYKTLPKLFFALLFTFYYCHYLLYLLVCYRLISNKKKLGLSPNSFVIMQILWYSLLAIWLVYVLNLFDDVIPYIIGPILYTIIAYVISIIVIKKGYLETVKYKTTSVSDEQIDKLFASAVRIIVHEEQFRNRDLTLKSLSKLLNVTSQTLSMVINTKTKTNFNGYINKFRIEETIRMFRDERYKDHTIASISFEVGFNSISSFNAAFKHHTQTTPKAYREKISK